MNIKDTANDITFTWPSEKAMDLLASLVGAEEADRREGYTRDCLSDTCCCVTHDTGHWWIKVPAEYAGLFYQYRGTVHGYGGTVTVEERQEKLRREAILEAQRLKEEKKARFAAAQETCKKLYSQKWELVWSRRIRWALEEPVATTAIRLAGVIRNGFRLPESPKRMSRFRQDMCPLSGPRFESAIEIAKLLA